MSKFYIAQLGKPSIQWRAWFRALAKSGFELQAVSPLAMELQAFRVRPGEILLLDGMLPHLARCIKRTYARSPGATIIVATEDDLSPAKSEVVDQNGTTCVSGPMPASKFAAMVQSMALHKAIA